MKRLKTKMARVLAITLVASMSFACLSTNAWAVDDPFQDTAAAQTIEIESSMGTHSYKLYQIFGAVYTNSQNELAEVQTGDGTSGTISNITWGKSIYSTGSTSYNLASNLVKALKSSTMPDGTTNSIASYFSALPDGATAAQVAEKLAQLTTAEQVHDFATIAASVMNAQGNVIYEESSDPSGSDSTGYTYTYDNLARGYYLVEQSVQDGETVYSRYLVQVSDSVTTIEEKTTDNPGLTKQVRLNGETDDDWGSDHDMASGDVLNFKLESVVPDMTYYTTYYFVMNDTLCAGLTVDENSFVVKVGDQVISKKSDVDTSTNSKWYELTKTTDSSTGVTTMKIVFNNFVQYQSSFNADNPTPVTVTYNAEANTETNEPVIGDGDSDTANTNYNTATLTYSNNPNYDYEGGNEPLDGEPTNVTPEQSVYTFTTALDMTKVNAEGQALQGAQFELTGERLVSVVEKKQVFVAKTPKSGQTAYYLLKDGNYTDISPTAEGAVYDQYASPETTYVLEEQVTSYVDGTNDIESQTLTVGNDGVLNLEGLAAGTYTLTETKAPAGYELLSEPIEFTIGYTAPESATPSECTWTIDMDEDTNGDDSVTYEVDEDGRVTFSIENKASTILPNTGGIGTTVFYVTGTVLVLGAAGVLVVRKKREVR